MSERTAETIELMAHGPADTLAVARAVAQRVQVGDVIGLIGELGAGKTLFVRGMAEGLGIDPEQVSSPTFVLMQEYEADPAGGANAAVLVHIDAYRLQGGEELASMGWVDEGAEVRAGAVTAVEWAERVSEAFGADWLEVSIDHAPAGRRITLRGHGTWRDRLMGFRV